ncbi:MAG: TraB/GumN family protein [Treponema sp.]|nr:TraB/GumN family protein [Treponema sp.]
MSQTQKRLELHDASQGITRTITLLGTAHISKESIEEVTTLITGQKPACVAIELDEQRLAAINDPESWRKMDIIKVLREKKGFLLLANLVLSGFQRRMGANVGVKPGDEMKAAYECAKEQGIPTAMVDRPIQTTLRRAWSCNSLWGKCKLLAALLSSAFDKEEVSGEQIENLKSRSEMDSMMSEISDFMPVVKSVLIDERDRYLASHIWKAATEVSVGEAPASESGAAAGAGVLAVLGAGHLPGVEKHLVELAAGRESADTQDIDSVPPKGVGAKVAGWVIPVLIVALIAAGFYFGGRNAGAKMALDWILWNGALSAIGAVIAGAHPLVILAAFAGAPITSLCPLVGVGMLTGILQAVLCKPKVADMETLQDDVSNIKGFYKNRILRVLLVFLLSSFGSSAGTFIAGASFVGKITAFVKALFVK